jgi:PmbA protein
MTQDTQKKHAETVRNAAQLAIKKGAKECAAMLDTEREVQVRVRDGKLEKLAEASSAQLTLRLYANDRYSAVTTSDLRPEALDRFITNALDLTRALAKDPFRALPEPSLYTGQANAALQLEDSAYTALDGTERRRRAEALEAAARSGSASHPSIVSVEADFEDAFRESFQFHTNGFEGSRRTTQFGMSVGVTVKDADGRRPNDYAAASARFLSELPTPEAVGQHASARAVARLGSRKPESKVMTVVVENRAAMRLFGQLFQPLSAAALQQKRSFLDGKVGQPIGSKLLDVTDDPFKVKGFGSRLFDREGIAARELPIFSEGKLRNFYIDTYYGKKLKLAPTTASMSNLRWKLGEANLDALIAQVKDGLLITGFLGGNSNPVTADFSAGASGFRIRNGKRAEPISEGNMAGNHLTLWKGLVAVGNDPYPSSAGYPPSLVFENVQIAGA